MSSPIAWLVTTLAVEACAAAALAAALRRGSHSDVPPPWLAAVASVALDLITWPLALLANAHGLPWLAVEAAVIGAECLGQSVLLRTRWLSSGVLGAGPNLLSASIGLV